MTTDRQFAPARSLRTRMTALVVVPALLLFAGCTPEKMEDADIDPNTATKPDIHPPETDPPTRPDPKKPNPRTPGPEDPPTPDGPDGPDEPTGSDDPNTPSDEIIEAPNVEALFVARNDVTRAYELLAFPLDGGAPTVIQSVDTAIRLLSMHGPSQSTLIFTKSFVEMTPAGPSWDYAFTLDGPGPNDVALRLDREFGAAGLTRDGRWLIGMAGGRVYAYPIDGGDSIELGQSPLNQLVIGPGDDEVLIRDNGMVWVSAATGAKRHIVLGGAQPPFIAAFAGGYESVWSEDRFVVDAQPNDTTERDLFLLDPNGAVAERLTDTADAQENDMIVDPTGTRIVFTSRPIDTGVYTDDTELIGGIDVIDLTTGDRIRVMEVDFFNDSKQPIAFSPDGASLMIYEYQALVEDSTYLFTIVRRDGANPRRMYLPAGWTRPQPGAAGLFRMGD